MAHDQMKSSNAKILIGCATAVVIPCLIIVALIAGLWLKAFNDARAQQHLSVWGAVEKWRAESRAEQDRADKDKKMTDQEKDADEAREAKLWGNPALAHSLRVEREKRRQLEESRIGWLTIAQFMFLGTAAYLIPTAVAVFRRHPQKMAIIALNLLLGWSIVGWAGALVWALVKDLPAAKT
jgi:hypothetical protein